MREHRRWPISAHRFTTAELRDLAARASSIDDRLAGGFVPVDAPDTASRIERRVAAWCEVATAGNTALFRRRLARDGIDLDVFRPLLGDVALAPDAPTPAWADTFEWVAAAMGAPPRPDAPLVSSSVLDPEEPIPFEELLAPIALAASERRDGPGATRDNLTETADAKLLRALVRRLSRLLAPSLFDGFSLARMSAARGMPRAVIGGRPATSGRTAYEAYLAAFRDDGLRNLFEERPVLARLVATVVKQWIEATTILLDRLREDVATIGETFAPGRLIGRVVDLRWGLSDPHNGGQTVCQLTFDDGLEVGYKPKDLSLDVAWARYLGWLHANGAPPSARAARVVARDGYGWVAWLAVEPCRDEDEAASYFHRAGAMLCLFHLLSATDFHYENVLAVRDSPTPIDVETLLQPGIGRRVEGSMDGASTAASRIIERSVLKCGYLPVWTVGPGGDIVALGGLNAPSSEGHTDWTFRCTNTDAMEYGRYSVSHPEAERRGPILHGESLEVSDYATEVASGFEAMYRFLLARSDDIVAADGPLAEFDHQRVRVVLRPTSVYATIQSRSLERHSLTNGIDWSLNFDFFTRLSALADPDDPLTRVQASERRSLQQADIPFFTTRSDGTTLEPAGGRALEGWLDEASFSQVRRHARELSEEGLAWELGFIRFALDSREDPTTPQAWPIDAAAPEVSRQAGFGLAAALKIGAVLEESAIRGHDGAAWIGASPLPGGSTAQLGVIGNDLYSGRAGVALFLAALYRISGAAAPRDLSIEALGPLRRQLEDEEHAARLTRTMGIGGTFGLGSVVYTMVKTAELLGEPSLLIDARRVADLITTDAIARDSHLDVLGGSAGTLLSLLALERAAPDQQILEKAVACGQRLLDAQIDAKAGGRAWRTTETTPLTGFSRGAAGIAYALLRLQAITADETLRDAAVAAIDYETAVFSSDVGNWPDLRTSATRFRCQWCHGASGIGMARLGGLTTLAGSQVTDDIAIAIETTLAEPKGPLDRLCCGNFGRLEFLFMAAQRLGRADLASVARARARQLSSDAERTGDYRWSEGIDRNNPGFFYGLSGIGYTLLRFERPDLLPSVLLWE